MKNVITKFRALERRKELLNDFVWEIFHKYIEDTRTNFNGPDEWEIESNRIHFTGTDGRRGCYDPKSLSIPFEFFEDYDKAMGELKKSEEIKADAERRKRVAIQEEEEKKTLRKFLEKYPNGLP